MLRHAALLCVGRGQRSQAQGHGKGVSHEPGGARKEGTQGMGEAPQEAAAQQLAGGRLASGGPSSAEPLESRCGFQMKAIFVLQNLKPPLPRVYDRDK